MELLNREKLKEAFEEKLSQIKMQVDLVLKEGRYNARSLTPLALAFAEMSRLVVLQEKVKELDVKQDDEHPLAALLKRIQGDIEEEEKSEEDSYLGQKVN